MLDHRPIDDRQHLLRGGRRQRPEPGAEAPDQDDCPHQPVGAVVAVVSGALSVPGSRRAPSRAGSCRRAVSSRAGGSFGGLGRCPRSGRPRRSGRSAGSRAAPGGGGTVDALRHEGDRVGADVLAEPDVAEVLGEGLRPAWPRRRPSSALFQWTTLTVAGLPPQVVSPSLYRRPSNGSALGSLISVSVTFMPTWSKNLPRVACLPAAALLNGWMWIEPVLVGVDAQRVVLPLVGDVGDEPVADEDAVRRRASARPASGGSSESAAAWLLCRAKVTSSRPRTIDGPDGHREAELSSLAGAGGLRPGPPGRPSWPRMPFPWVGHPIARFGYPVIALTARDRSRSSSNRAS